MFYQNLIIDAKYVYPVALVMQLKSIISNVAMIILDLICVVRVNTVIR